MKTFIVALTLTIAGISSSVLLAQAAAAGEISSGGSRFEARTLQPTDIAAMKIRKLHPG